MEDFFAELFRNIHPVVLGVIIGIVTALIIIAVSFKGFNRKDELSADVVCYKWHKSSKIMKLQGIFSGLISLVMLLFMFSIISYFDSDELGIKPLIDFKKIFNFENMEVEEIFSLIEKLLKGVIIFGSVILIIFCSFNVATYLDIAKWLRINEIDCYSILQNKNGTKASKKYITMGFLINQRPSLKRTIYLKTFSLEFLSIMLFVLLHTSCRLLLLYEIEVMEWLNSILLSPSVIICCVLIFVAIILNVTANRTLRKARAELLDYASPVSDKE